MPDWLSHIGFTYLIIWIISRIDKYDKKCRKYYLFFLIGGVMPDLERIFALIADLINNYQLKEFFSVVFTSGFHTILGVSCIAIAMTSFFPKEDSKKVFISFLLGGLSHLLLDGIMWPWPNMGLVLFYPFLTGPRGSFSFHLVWPGGFVPLIVISMVVALTLVIDAIQKKSLLSLAPLRQLLKK
jgi:hypothetical protein